MLKLCYSSRLLRSTKLLKKLNFFRKGRADQATKLTSDLSWLTPSFAAMEVSAQMKHVFKFIDANGDGKLSPSELKRILLSLGHEEAAAAKEAQGIVREMDFNGDGYVDLDEFMIAMGDGNGFSRESVIVEAFKVFDEDDDGLISAKELQRVLGRLGCRKCSVKECRKMINGVDRDGDGFVNFEEFKNMMRTGY